MLTPTTVIRHVVVLRLSLLPQFFLYVEQKLAHKGVGMPHPENVLRAPSKSQILSYITVKIKLTIKYQTDY